MKKANEEEKYIDRCIKIKEILKKHNLYNEVNKEQVDNIYNIFFKAKEETPK